jgi:hypothetical protein
MTRRSALAAPFLQLASKAAPPIQGGFTLDAFPLGHKLRDHASFPAPKQEKRLPLVIIGGGMAGLSAAWHLRKRGFHDFVILEMEPEAGGNSRHGQNEVSAYPWGAHYVPVPNRKSPLIRELFQELGLMDGEQLNELHLCHSPQERLFLHGRWQYGLEPELALGPAARDQFRRFDDIVKQLHASGNYTVPHELGNFDPALEAQPFSSWLKAKGFDAPALLWYLDYATRDDYGSPLHDTSAWAGLHYFAGRDHDEKGPFTWPEGNGWLAKQLIAKAAPQIRKGEPVYQVRRAGNTWRVLTPQCAYLAENVIWSAPSFLASYIVEGAPKAETFRYSPWVTANITLHRLPKASQSTEWAWDNVIYGSPSLGYVVATHQNLATVQERSVWTWYYAMAEMEPLAARRMILEKDWSYWRDFILKDLAKPHPDLADCISRIDVFRNGHAMVRPSPGFLQSPARQQLKRGPAGLFFAHSDLSGISIFEEAQYQGVEAAKAALQRLGKSA